MWNQSGWRNLAFEWYPMKKKMMRKSLTGLGGSKRRGMGLVLVMVMRLISFQSSIMISL